MPFFSETAAAALAGRVVRVATLVRLEFTSQTMRIWTGFGPLAAGGYTWSGVGEFGTISGLEIPTGSTAPVTTLGLSGIEPDLVSKALSASDEVKGRPAAILIQFFDEQWRTLDNPYAVMSGVMDVMTISAPTPESRSIEVSVEWLLTRRVIPPFGMLSDRDQKNRFPGDRGLEQIAAMQNKSTQWPTYL